MLPVATRPKTFEAFPIIWANSSTSPESDGSVEPLTAKSFLPRRKGGHLRLQQMLLLVPKLVGDSRVGSSRKLPGQLRCRQPTHLASAACTCFRLLGPFHRESQQGTAQDVARRYATWILRRVYRGLSSDFCQALGFQTCLERPVRPVLRLLFWRPKMGRVAHFVRQSRWFSTVHGVHFRLVSESCSWQSMNRDGHRSSVCLA